MVRTAFSPYCETSSLFPARKTAAIFRDHVRLFQNPPKANAVITWRNHFLSRRRRSFALHSTFINRFNVESILAFKLAGLSCSTP